MKKNKWQTPKLKIISRMTPQEFVLTGCKQQQSASNRDPGSLVQMCGANDGAACGACQSRGQS